MRVWLRQLREEHDLTEQEMAKELGLQPEFYASIEHGTISPDIPIPIIVASKITECFDVPMSKQVIYENDYLRNK